MIVIGKILSMFCRTSVSWFLTGRVAASPAAARIAGSAIPAPIATSPETVPGNGVHNGKYFLLF